MSGLSRTPGKRVWANPHRGFESRPLRHDIRKPPLRWLFFSRQRGVALVAPTIFMADAMREDTSVMFPGTISVVVASAATLP
jgi:hypothetical protein